MLDGEPQLKLFSCGICCKASSARLSGWLLSSRVFPGVEACLSWCVCDPLILLFSLSRCHGRVRYIIQQGEVSMFSVHSAPGPACVAHPTTNKRCECALSAMCGVFSRSVPCFLALGEPGAKQHYTTTWPSRVTQSYWQNKTSLHISFSGCNLHMRR